MQAHYKPKPLIYKPGPFMFNPREEQEKVGSPIQILGSFMVGIKQTKREEEGQWKLGIPLSDDSKVTEAIHGRRITVEYTPICSKRRNVVY